MSDPFDEIIGAQREASFKLALRVVLDSPLGTLRYAKLLHDFPAHEPDIIEAMDVLDQDTNTTVSQQVRIIRRRIKTHGDAHAPLAGEDRR